MKGDEKTGRRKREPSFPRPLFPPMIVHQEVVPLDRGCHRAAMTRGEDAPFPFFPFPFSAISAFAIDIE